MVAEPSDAHTRRLGPFLWIARKKMISGCCACGARILFSRPNVKNCTLPQNQNLTICSRPHCQVGFARARVQSSRMRGLFSCTPAGRIRARMCDPAPDSGKRGSGQFGKLTPRAGVCYTGILISPVFSGVFRKGRRAIFYKAACGDGFVGSDPNSPLKNSEFAACSKTMRCKAREFRGTRRTYGTSR